MTSQQKSMSFVWMTLCLAALSGCFGGTAAAQPAPKPSLTITPSSPINISGPQGGPFSPPSFQYHLSASTGTIRFAIAAPFWLTADPRAGTVGTHQRDQRSGHHTQDRKIDDKALYSNGSVRIDRRIDDPPRRCGPRGQMYVSP
jgi:hypothetical protein